MGPNQWTPKEVAIELLDTHSGLGVRSVGPVGDFLEGWFLGGKSYC